MPERASPEPTRSATARRGLMIWSFIQFQVGWFALVLSMGAGRPWIGVAVQVVLTAIHLRWFALRGEARLLAAAAAIGWVWESIVHATGLARFPGYPPEILIAPPWMAMLWVNFATTLNHSLSWLKGRVLWAGLFSLAGAPLAFAGGARAGAIQFPQPAVSLTVIGIAYAFLIPLVLHLADRFCPGPVVPEGDSHAGGS